jgi:hypothetical protein
LRLAFYVLRSAFYVLSFTFGVLRFAFCVLRLAFYVLRFMFCVQRSAFYVLRLPTYGRFGVLGSAFRIQGSTFTTSPPISVLRFTFFRFAFKIIV